MVPDDWANFAGYNLFTHHLLDRGYNEGSGYRTLYAPNTSAAMYTNPMRATPDIILNDVQGLVDQAKVGSYASRVNLVGHSFGGLVSQFYASQRPDNVNKVITVGTPFKGITNIYKEIFSPMWNRAMVDANITTPGGQPNLILWGVPKDYTAFTLPPNPPAGINVQVSNSYTYAPQPSVEYHYIYATNVDTDKTVTLALNSDGTWYRSISVSTAKGDGTVLDFSAANSPGPTGGNIYRHPIQVDHMERTNDIYPPITSTTHGSLFMDDIVHEEVVKAIFRGTPIESTW
jgi:pimeloyl-ACP methyl ester carboxylesterase